MTKKPLFFVVMLLCGVIAGAIITNAVFAFTGFYLFGGHQREAVSVPVEKAESADITVMAYRILEHIRDDDFIALSRIVHPEYGVVLSPSATINLSTDRRFSAEQIASLDTDSTVYVWGVYNGIGEPIELTPAEYIAKFVPAADFIEAKILGINQIVRSGNALENISDVFPNVKFIDFHLSGEELMEEFSWSSLRLGFEEYDGYYKLIVIAYSTWTA